MAIDAIETFNSGEKRPVYIEVNAGAGRTMKVVSTTSTPAGTIDPVWTVRVTDKSGITKGTGTPGFDTPTQQKVQVWPVLDVGTGGLNLADDTYDVEIKFQAQGYDKAGVAETFLRTYVRHITLTVE